MSSHNKGLNGQKPPTKAMPVTKQVQQATGGKSPVKSGKTTPKSCC
jgi:hypothetical protein